MDKKYQKIGKCSKCGSENVTYGSSRIDGDMVGYEIDCEDCDCYGIEWYGLVYSGTNMGKSGCE